MGWVCRAGLVATAVAVLLIQAGPATAGTGTVAPLMLAGSPATYVGKAKIRINFAGILWKWEISAGFLRNPQWQKETSVLQQGQEAEAYLPTTGAQQQFVVGGTFGATINCKGAGNTGGQMAGSRAPAAATLEKASLRFEECSVPDFPECEVKPVFSSSKGTFSTEELKGTLVYANQAAAEAGDPTKVDLLLEAAKPGGPFAKFELRGTCPVAAGELTMTGQLALELGAGGTEESERELTGPATPIGSYYVNERTMYAALGDSYSSGEGIPGTGNGSSNGSNTAYYAKSNTPAGEEGEEYLWAEKVPLPENINECHRDPKSYPGRVAEALFPGAPVTAEKEVFQQQPGFAFRACSGALIENVWPGYGQWAESVWEPGPASWAVLKPSSYNPKAWPFAGPEQASWLESPAAERKGGAVRPNPNIGLVTFSIGGNDSGFALVGSNCGTTSNSWVTEHLELSEVNCRAVLSEWELGVKGTSTKKERNCNGVIEPLPQGPGRAIPGCVFSQAAAGIPSIATKLPVLLTQVHTAAPNARIRVVLYPLALHDTGAAIQVGEATITSECFLVCAVNEKVKFSINPTPVKWLNAFTVNLDKAIETAVKKWATANAGVNAEVVNTREAFKGHQLGDPEPWINALVFRSPIIHKVVREEEEPRTSTESFHPNCRGHKTEAEEVLRTLKVHALKGWTCP